MALYRAGKLGTGRATYDDYQPMDGGGGQGCGGVGGWKVRSAAAQMALRVQASVRVIGAGQSCAKTDKTW